MDNYSIGDVQAIGASGKVWMGFHAVDIADLLFGELEKADSSIQISSFSTGHDSSEMRHFFNLLEKKLGDPTMKINMIINDDGKNNTVTSFARKKIQELECDKPEQFFPQFFKQTKINNLNKILHAKLIVIDGTTALIGSANISKGALESNYEIMLKIKGNVAVDLSRMLSKLSEEIRKENA
ncbi:phospholipase D family protein [Nitrosopumilus sp.]|uniref:phospholipase D family protein n=1 Tax=Nitrosopumilus sp. TaxID=2024843 RepID=UPI00247CDA51|nr:phospholipase D family protein [Nitrosopumilus sp.]MCV0409374.1 hypothetical protein [Nitrosopumilus sp.]